MIIRHSNKILEQLSEIESLIQQFEEYLDKNGMDCDREKLLVKLLKAQEVKITSRVKDRSN